MKIKGLTSDQEQIVNDVINAFKETNQAKEKVDSSIISQVLNIAKELTVAEQKYYNDIDDHNLRLLKQQTEVFNAFHSKLKELFKQFPQIDLFVNSSNTAIRIGYKHFNDEGFNLGCNYFWVRTDLTLMKNPILKSIDFCFNNNKKYKTVKKYDKVVSSIELLTNEVKLEDFEFSDIFKEKLLLLFQTNLPK